MKDKTTINEGKIILISGATGRLGGALINHLLEKGWKPRALTRNPDSEKAQVLARKGVDVVKGDMSDLQSLEMAMDNAYGVFSVQDYWVTGAVEEIQQGKNMVDAAINKGVQHFIYLSGVGAERKTGVEYIESKFIIEEYIRNSGLQRTILRPAAFMENYYISQIEKRILKGKLVDPILPDKVIQLIPTENIGAFVAAAFERPDEFIGLAIDIANDELTNPEIAETFSKVMGRPVRYKKLPMLFVRLFMNKEMYKMFRWLNKENGFVADIPALRHVFPEVKFTSLEEWLRLEGWGKGYKGIN